MKDFLKHEVKVGDEVVCIEKGYNNLILATVVKITPQKIKVKYPQWAQDREVMRTPDQFVKVADE